MEIPNEYSKTGATIELINALVQQDYRCSPSENCGPDGGGNDCYPNNYCNPDEKEQDCEPKV